MPAAPAFVEHRLSNRIRLRVPSQRGAADYFESLVACLAKHPDVEEVHADPRTAGILVLHGGDEKAILGAARERGLIALDEPIEASENTPQAVFSGRTGDLPSVNTLLAAVLGILGCVQVMRGRTLGPASELLWNAYALAGLLRGSPWLPVLGVAILVKLAKGPVLGSASSLFFYALAAYEMARRDLEGTKDIASPHRPDEE